MKTYNSPEVTLENAKYQLYTYDISNLEGQLLTLIDASIVDAVQRKALKDIIRTKLWDWIIPKAVTGGGSINADAEAKRQK